MTGGDATSSATSTCSQCGTELAPSLLSCPVCHALVHTARLKELASRADSATASGDLSNALTHWREALDLLPAHSRQRETVAERIADLGRRVDTGGVKPKAPDGRPLHRQAWGAIIAAGIFILSKAKLLLLGLTKASTFFSMLAFLGVYWEIWGWKFALGLVVSIYIHEMGHVAALLRYGIKASAPMFIPGVGALVRLKQRLTDPRQDARVGLAGPIWGLGAALAALGLSRATGSQSLAAIAQMGGVINLFNLIPVWQLDGARGFRSLSRDQRWLATAAIGVAWAMTSQGLLLLLGVAAAFQALGKNAAEKWDIGALATYVALVWSLAWLAILPVVTPLPLTASP